MFTEMVLLNDILLELDKLNQNDKEMREERIINQLKPNLPSSPWLKDTINNVKGRFSWSTGKFFTMVFISFMINIVGGWTSYILDIYTDADFIADKFRLANKNFTLEESKPDLTDILYNCRDQYDLENCYKSMLNTTKIGRAHV